jgi:prefoldin beta subunit
MSEKDLEAYQITQQQLQLILLQKQQLKIQSEEISSALNELKKVGNEKVYKIVGPILVEVNKDEVIKELNEKNENLNSRIEILEKQEERLRKNLTELSKILEKEMESKEE